MVIGRFQKRRAAIVYSFKSKKGFKTAILITLALILFAAYPVQLSYGLTKPTVYCSYNHSLALKEDGTVWAWGNNMYGQLGDGSTTNRSIPVQVKNLQNI